MPKGKKADPAGHFSNIPIHLVFQKKKPAGGELAGFWFSGGFARLPGSAGAMSKQGDNVWDAAQMPHPYPPAPTGGAPPGRKPGGKTV